MEFYLIVICLIVSILNLILLFFLGTFLVRLNERMMGMFNDLIDILGNSFSVAPVQPSISDVQSKTWDQKLEDEMDAAYRRMRAQSGLSDLPFSPPYDPETSVNKKANEGLIIADK